ncbi:MAG TPA: arginase family protein [Trueperaceae bacterium]|nr:arginase family protein [Trueperaceae bacterium]
MRHHELPSTGPATFFKAPHRPDADRGEAHIGVLGVPFDEGASSRPGARFGPMALRDASGRYALSSEGFYDLEAGVMRLAGARLVDVGDVDPIQNAVTETFDRVTSAARRLRTVARLPVFVGGDHSVSFPVLRAYDDVPDLHVVQLDAHLGFSDVRRGSRFTGATAFRRATEEVPGLKRITALGLRELNSGREAVDKARARGHALLTARRVREDLEGALAEIPERAAVYLSIDVDVLDPAVLPGTSDPEPDGLGYAHVMRLIDAVVGRNRLIGLDLVELAPHLDPTGRSAQVAARLLMDTFALWWDPARMV